jgi:sulfur-carrier protein
MKVKVKLIANLREHLPPNAVGNIVEIEVAPTTTVADVLIPFDIPMDDTSVIVVNGHTVALNSQVAEGDVVTAFSAIAGG